jgi:hypothetical protein
VLALDKERSTCLELLLQLNARVYLLVLVWICRIIMSRVKGARGWLRAYGWVKIL